MNVSLLSHHPVELVYILSMVAVTQKLSGIPLATLGATQETGTLL